MSKFFALVLLFLIASIPSPAQINVFYSFLTGGSNPQAGLVQATDGWFYGTTFDTAYKVNRYGQEETVANFCPQGYPDCPSGYALSGLVQAVDGDLYGTAIAGASDACDGSGCGAVYKLTLDGTLTTLHSFTGPDGIYPQAALVQAADGNFYGTTSRGGSHGQGTVFRMTPDGTLKTIYTFCAKASCIDGAKPSSALIQASDGLLYGTTSSGGTARAGVIFKITTQGVLTTLYSFTGGADGSNPYAGLVESVDRNFYGTTYGGGAYGLGTLYKVSSGGELTSLYSFCAEGLPYCADGASPVAGLIEVTPGNFWGTTTTGASGIKGAGTIFSFFERGGMSTFYTFCSGQMCYDGADPKAVLLEGTDGNLYGTTYKGGIYGDGEVFGAPIGETPFVQTTPMAGRAGTSIAILGTNLTGATSVTFGGKQAEFTVISPSQITALVPANAITARVHVLTPNGELSSKVPFFVMPNSKAAKH